MQQTDVKIVASPNRVRLVVDGNIKHEDTIIDYEALFHHLGHSISNATFHYEWTADLEEYDRDSEEVVFVIPGEVVTTSTEVDLDAAKAEYDAEQEEEEEECEHLHWSQEGNGGDHTVQCMDCGEWGTIWFESDLEEQN